MIITYLNRHINGGKILDEKLMSISLGINDDLNKTNERIENLQIKKKPGAFISSFANQFASSTVKSNNPKIKEKNAFNFIESSENNNTSNTNTKPNTNNNFFDIFNDGGNNTTKITNTTNPNVSTSIVSNDTFDNLFGGSNTTVPKGIRYIFT